MSYRLKSTQVLLDTLTITLIEIEKYIINIVLKIILKEIRKRNVLYTV